MAQTETEQGEREPLCGMRPGLNPDGPPCTFPRLHRGECSWDLTAELQRSGLLDVHELSTRLHAALFSLDTTEQHAEAVWLAGQATGALQVTAHALEHANEQLGRMQEFIAAHALAARAAWTWHQQHDALTRIVNAFLEANSTARVNQNTISDLLEWHAAQGAK